MTVVVGVVVALILTSLENTIEHICGDSVGFLEVESDMTTNVRVDIRVDCVGIFQNEA